MNGAQLFTIWARFVDPSVVECGGWRAQRERMCAQAIQLGVTDSVEGLIG